MSEQGFEQFMWHYKKAFDSGALKCTTELKDLDYAILYSLGMEMSRAGVDTFALEAIPGLIKKWCGEDVYSRVLGGE